MKGLFYVHSAITEKIAKKVSKNKHKDSLFVEDYRYSCGLNNSIGIEEIYDLRPNERVFSLWKKILNGDKKIKKYLIKTKK